MNFIAKKRVVRQWNICITFRNATKSNNNYLNVWHFQCGNPGFEIGIWIIATSDFQTPQSNVCDASSHIATFANNEHLKFIPFSFFLPRIRLSILWIETDDNIIWKRVCLLGAEKPKQTIKFDIEITLASLPIQRKKSTQCEWRFVIMEGNSQFKNGLQIAGFDGKRWIMQPKWIKQENNISIISSCRSTETEMSIKRTI